MGTKRKAASPPPTFPVALTARQASFIQTALDQLRARHQAAIDRHPPLWEEALLILRRTVTEIDAIVTHVESETGRRTHRLPTNDDGSKP